MRAPKTGKNLVLFQLVLATATCLPAAETAFNPSLALSQFYTSNVTFVSEEQSADTYTVMSLLLPVTIRSQRSNALLSYSPTYQAFYDSDTFDNLSHVLNASLDTSWSRTNSLDLVATLYRGQDQGRADSDLEGDFFLTERSTRTEGNFAVSYSDRLGSAWLWGIGASAAALSYEEISGTEVNTPQDRSGYGAAVWLGRQVSPRTSIGFRAEVDQYRYDISADQLVQLYSFGVSRRLSRQSNFEFSVGGFISDPDPERSLPGETSDSSTGFQGSLAYEKSFESVDLRLDASHRPTLGATRAGLSTNSYASFTLGRPLAKKLSGSLALRYARTEPLEEILDGSESAALAGNLAWSVLRVLSVGLGVGYTNQSPLTAGSIPTSADSDFFTAGVSLAWYPLANRPIAQGAI